MKILQNIYSEKRIYHIVIYILFISYLYIINKLYLQSQSLLQTWTASDWLINYQDGGFKRRGLSGSILFLLQDFTGFSLSTILFMIQLFLYTYVYGKVIYHLKNVKIDNYFLSFLLLPFGLLFSTIDSFFLGRKDIFLLAIAIYFVMGKLSKTKIITTYTLLLIGCFLHEMIFFYIPFFIFYYYIKTKNIRLSTYFFTILPYSSIILVIYFYGSKINNGDSIIILSNRGIKFVSRNIFLYKESLSEFDFIKKYYISNLVLLSEFFICIFYMGTYIKIYLKKYFSLFLVANLILLIWVVPLFYLAVDWCRWAFMYITLLYLCIYLFLDKNIENKIVFNKNEVKPLIILIPIILYCILFLHIQHDYLLELIDKKFNVNLVKKIDFSK